MAKNEKPVLKPDEIVMSKIYLIREQKVMIDQDLAHLYGTETKRLKEAVKRNISRFPGDFMFELTRPEFDDLRSQFAASNTGRGGARYLPMAFTEQGVTMLSCILNSDRAIAVNIQVIRIFNRMRETLLTHKDILLQMEKMEKKLLCHDEQIGIIFGYLKRLIDPAPVARPRIGFRRKGEEVEEI